MWGHLITFVAREIVSFENSIKMKKAADFAQIVRDSAWFSSMEKVFIFIAEVHHFDKKFFGTFSTNGSWTCMCQKDFGSHSKNLIDTIKILVNPIHGFSVWLLYEQNIQHLLYALEKLEPKLSWETHWIEWSSQNSNQHEKYTRWIKAFSGSLCAGLSITFERKFCFFEEKKRFFFCAE